VVSSCFLAELTLAELESLIAFVVSTDEFEEESFPESPLLELLHDSRNKVMQITIIYFIKFDFTDG
jgi:hypothetical protein